MLIIDSFRMVSIVKEWKRCCEYSYWNFLLYLLNYLTNNSLMNIIDNDNQYQLRIH